MSDRGAQNCTTKDSSISRHGAQNCTTNQSVLDIAFGAAAAKLYGKSPLLSIINPAISDPAHRLLALLAVPGIGESVLSVEDIVSLMRWSARKVKYRLAELRRLGIVEVSRAPNKPNAYRIKSEVFAEIRRETRTERVMKAKPKLHPCEACRRLTGGKSAYCRTCRADKRTEQISRRVAREEIARPRSA